MAQLGVERLFDAITRAASVRLDRSARLRPLVSKVFGARNRRVAPVCSVEGLGRKTPCRVGAGAAKRAKRSGAEQRRRRLTAPAR